MSELYAAAVAFVLALVVVAFVTYVALRLVDDWEDHLVVPAPGEMYVPPELLLAGGEGPDGDSEAEFSRWELVRTPSDSLMNSWFNVIEEEVVQSDGYVYGYVERAEPDDAGDLLIRIGEGSYPYWIEPELLESVDGDTLIESDQQGLTEEEK